MDKSISFDNSNDDKTTTPKRRVSFSDNINNIIKEDSEKKPKRRVSFSDEFEDGQLTETHLITNIDEFFNDNNNNNNNNSIDCTLKYGTLMNLTSLYRDNENDKYELSKTKISSNNSKMNDQIITTITNNNINNNNIIATNNIRLDFTNLQKDGIYEIEWINTDQSLGIILEEEEDGGCLFIMIKDLLVKNNTNESSIIENSIKSNDILIMINDTSMIFHGFKFVQETLKQCKLAKQKIVLTFLRTSIVPLESFLKRELEIEDVNQKYVFPIELFNIEQEELPSNMNKYIDSVDNTTTTTNNTNTKNNNNNNENDIKENISVDIKEYIINNIDQLKPSEITDLKRLLENAEKNSLIIEKNDSKRILNDLAPITTTTTSTNITTTTTTNNNNNNDSNSNNQMSLPVIVDSKDTRKNKDSPSITMTEPQTENIDLPIIRTPSIKVREPDIDYDLKSINSVDSNHSISTQSVIPFPFTSHPSLPHVDKYIKDEKLTMEYLKKVLNEEKDQKFKRVKAKKKSKKTKNINSTDDEDDSLFSIADVQTLMVYFQSFCDNNGEVDDIRKQEISLPDMEAAFRKYKQATITLDDEMYARELMVSFEWLLQECNLTPYEWFLVADIKGAIGGDGKLTYGELVEGINKLCDSIDVPRWRESDIFKILKYMDPSGDGDLTAAEVKLAFKRYYMPPESKSIITRAGPILERLEWYLHKQRLRVRDLFTKIDIDGSMTISIEELSDAMRKIMGKRSLNSYKKLTKNINNNNNNNNIKEQKYESNIEVNSMYSDDDISVSSDFSMSDISVSSLDESVYSNSDYSNYSHNNNRGKNYNIYSGIPSRSFAHKRKFLNMPSLTTPVKKVIDKKILKAGDLLPERNLDIVIEARKVVVIRDDTPNYLKPEVSHEENILASFNVPTCVYSPINVKLKPIIKTPKVNKYCNDYHKKFDFQDSFANSVQRNLKKITYNICIK